MATVGELLDDLMTRDRDEVVAVSLWQLDDALAVGIGDRDVVKARWEAIAGVFEEHLNDGSVLYDVLERLLNRDGEGI